MKEVKEKVLLMMLTLLLVSILTFNIESVKAPGIPPDLTVFDPEIDGLSVSINGVVFPGTPSTSITRIHWDWGDGNEEDHWFPASHTYSSYGDYTITVTAHQSDGLTSTETKHISLIVSLEYVDIDPDTLNLKSKGKWITAYIELPEGYDVNGIDVSTVRLDDTIPAELRPTEIGDYDNDGIPDLMVKFSRQDLIEILSVGQATLTITGEVNGTSFEGSDTIRAIGK